MGSTSSKSETELPENKLESSSASESIHVEFERIEKNLNKSIHTELVKAEEDIAKLFIKSEKIKSSSNPEEISITVGTTSDRPKKTKKTNKSKLDETISATSPITSGQKRDMDLSKSNKLSETSESISATSPVTPGQKKDMQNLPTMSSSSETESVVANTNKALRGGLTESEIDIRVVPLTNQLNGGSRSLNFSDSSPFITSEVFKKSLEQTGGAIDSEFDSNKLLNIIMQMGGDASEKSEKSEKSTSSTSDDDDEKDDDDDSLFSDEDEDDEDDKDDEDDDDDVFTDGKEPIQVARLKNNKNTSSMSRLSTPKSKDDSSSTSTSSSSNSSSDSSSSSSSSSSNFSSSSSDSDKLVTPAESSMGLAIPRRVTKNEKNVAPMASLGGLNSSESASVYILSSESSIGSRDINLLSFDEPAWDKPKKSKKSKK